MAVATLVSNKADLEHAAKGAVRTVPPVVVNAVANGAIIIGTAVAFAVLLRGITPKAMRDYNRRVAAKQF